MKLLFRPGSFWIGLSWHRFETRFTGTCLKTGQDCYEVSIWYELQILPMLALRWTHKRIKRLPHKERTWLEHFETMGKF